MKDLNYFKDLGKDILEVVVGIIFLGALAAATVVAYCMCDPW